MFVSIGITAAKTPPLPPSIGKSPSPPNLLLHCPQVHKQHNGCDEIDSSGKYSSGMLEYLLHTDEMLDEAPLYDEEVRREEEELADIDDY